MDGRKTNKLPDGVGKKIIEALKNQSQNLDYQQGQQYEEQNNPQQYAQSEQPEPQYNNQQYSQQFQQMPEPQQYSQQDQQDYSGNGESGYNSINPNIYMNEQSETPNWNYNDSDNSSEGSYQEPEYQAPNYVDEQYNNVPEEQHDYAGHSYEDTYAKEAREIEQFSYDYPKEDTKDQTNTIADSYDFYGQINYAQNMLEQLDNSVQQQVQRPTIEPAKRFTAFQQAEEDFAQPSRNPILDGFADNKSKHKPKQQSQPQSSNCPVNPDGNNNVEVLMRLVTQLPAGVTRQTGAQIIRQTMEALGVPMNNVLKDAQETQDDFARAIKNDMNKIEEYRNNIKILEGEVQNYRKESDKLEDLISLFILSEDDFKN